MKSGTGYYIMLTLLILLLFGVISIRDIFDLFGIILLVVAVLAVVGILLFRYRIRRLQKSFREGGERRTYTNGYGEAQRPKQNGRITITDSAPHQKNVSSDVGEYVEYEDIQDDEQSAGNR